MSKHGAKPLTDAEKEIPLVDQTAGKEEHSEKKGVLEKLHLRKKKGRRTKSSGAPVEAEETTPPLNISGPLDVEHISSVTKVPSKPATPVTSRAASPAPKEENEEKEEEAKKPVEVKKEELSADPKPVENSETLLQTLGGFFQGVAKQINAASADHTNHWGNALGLSKNEPVKAPEPQLEADKKLTTIKPT